MVGVCDVFMVGCQVFLPCVLVVDLCCFWGGRSCAGLLPDALVWLMMVYCRVEWGSCAWPVFVLRWPQGGGDSHEACSVSDPLLSLWGGAVTVIGLPDAASCDPESCSCPCLLCLGEWCWVVCIWGVVAQGFRPLSWSVAVVACVRFRLCRFSVLMVFRLVVASVKLWGEHGVSIGVGWLLSWVCDSGSCREQ